MTESKYYKLLDEYAKIDNLEIALGQSNYQCMQRKR